MRSTSSIKDASDFVDDDQYCNTYGEDKMDSPVQQLYRSHFRPTAYINDYYQSLDVEVEFFLLNLHRFFSSTTKSQQGEEETGNGLSSVLEIGCGPVPISMISASRHCEFIVASDFLELNRDKMALWVAGGSSGNGGINGSQDVQQQQVQQQEEDQLWLPFSRYVARLERLDKSTQNASSLRRDGDNNDEDDDDEATAASLLLDRVRRKVRAVVACNVFLPNPLATASEAASTVDEHTAVSSSSVVPPSTLETNSLFDVIISTLCLEFASVTVKDYSLAVANVASLLKPNGYLILQGALGNSHYWHNDCKFPSLPLSRKTVDEALVLAGCRLIDWKELPRCCPVENKPADHSAVFYCLSRKI